jgi:hypothetical protein
MLWRLRRLGAKRENKRGGREKIPRITKNYRKMKSPFKFTSVRKVKVE